MTPNPVSSTPVLRTTLLWSAAVTAILAVIGAVAGYAAGGVEGLWSALVGVGLAFAFLGITGGSILIANRWYGDALYVPIFFGIVLGGWILKFVVFIIVLLVLRGQAWLNPTVFFVSLVVGIIASLIIDVIVLMRSRVPHASDVTLPTAEEVGEGPDDAPGRL
ncbi:hypothetical protein QNO21_03580 [Microbacterium sp. zg-Y818]|uniref:hypothetical protein n=1 Tax=unclassified Microbacterium TaxID=2609290 RepID=UPI00214B313A|nr:MULTISPECIES: hypothetical protein [unclassified Microbacterium]MCR2801596.1 hypothetical protein [Microbacterium sp. zg.Y818]WIM23129.1 hypothetical protein QNO21_03580 [Microbacterium sp. zg-Y818]